MKKIKNILIACVATLTIVLPATARAQEEKILRVGVYGGVWQDYFKQGVVANFEKATGAKVVLEASTDPNFVAKIRAGRGANPPYDLLPLQPYSTQGLAAAGLIEPLDTSKISNFPDLNKSIVDHMSVQGKPYAVPFTIAQIVLAYRTDTAKKKPSSWIDLLDPAYAACGVALPAPSTTGSGPETLTGFSKALGGSLDNPATVNQIFEKLTAAKKQVVAFPASTADNQTLLTRGDVCIAPHWDGRIIQMKASGIPIDIVYPKEGGVAGMNGFVLTKGSKNTDLAYQFLDFVADPQSQAVFGNQIFYSMSNEKTPYSDAWMAGHPDGKPDLNKLIWLDYLLLAKETPGWQGRWESTFR
jgi:putative spermidine/putrescine transport system substrate-binding protein